MTICHVVHVGGFSYREGADLVQYFLLQQWIHFAQNLAQKCTLEHRRQFLSWHKVWYKHVLNKYTCVGKVVFTGKLMFSWAKQIPCLPCSQKKEWHIAQKRLDELVGINPELVKDCSKE